VDIVNCIGAERQIGHTKGIPGTVKSKGTEFYFMRWTCRNTVPNRLPPQYVIALLLHYISHMMGFSHGKKVTTLTHHRIYQVASQRMEHPIVSRIHLKFQCAHYQHDFYPYSTIQIKVQVEFPLYLTTANLSTFSKNRRFASEISLNLL
jgi:hypothetical protein